MYKLNILAHLSLERIKYLILHLQVITHHADLYLTLFSILADLLHYLFTSPVFVFLNVLLFYMARIPYKLRQLCLFSHQKRHLMRQQPFFLRDLLYFFVSIPHRMIQRIDLRLTHLQFYMHFALTLSHRPIITSGAFLKAILFRTKLPFDFEIIRARETVGCCLGWRGIAVVVAFVAVGENIRTKDYLVAEGAFAGSHATFFQVVPWLLYSPYFLLSFQNFE